LAFVGGVEKEFLSRPIGRRVTVVGLGHFGGGIGAARFLARLGARVTVTDLKDEAALAASIEKLSGLDIRYRLGGHDPDDFLSADLVCASPAVPRSAPLMVRARAAGVPITSEIRLFLAVCPATRTIGVTGSNGKTTTTSLFGSILAEARVPHHVGGNIGRSLVEDASAIAPTDLVVLELSSFQLEDLDGAGFSPDIAVVTNVVPNHLDRHGTLDAYVDAKRTIVRHQTRDGVAVLWADDPIVATFGGAGEGRATWFTDGALDSSLDGVCVRGGVARHEARGRSVDLFPIEAVRLPGAFNLRNALAAAAAGLAAGVTPAAIARGVERFRGVPHRLELVAEAAGVRWINDSKATTPEAAALALGALEARVVLIAGGYDKKVPLDAIAAAAARHCRSAILVGETAPIIRAALERAGSGDRALSAATLEEAVDLARSRAEPGDVVLLSPGCASYDMFSNFEERGDRFRALTNAAAARMAAPSPPEVGEASRR